MKSKDVIVVGISIGFLSVLRPEGYNLIEMSGLGDLPDTLKNHPGATVVVYNKPRQDTARRALTMLSAATQHIPVIVLVDNSTFEEYYDFMCLGAYDYFELNEDPVAIERAIRYAFKPQTRPAVQAAVA